MEDWQPHRNDGWIVSQTEKIRNYEEPTCLCKTEASEVTTYLNFPASLSLLIPLCNKT